MLSTYDRYIPGVGRTITRANIALEQKRRLECKQKPATPADIVEEFCTTRRFKKLDTKRHLARAMRLMKGE